MANDKKADQSVSAPAEQAKPLATQMFAAIVDNAADIAKGMVAVGRAAGAAGMVEAGGAMESVANKAKALTPDSIKKLVTVTKKAVSRKTSATKRAAKKTAAKKPPAKRSAAGKAAPKKVVARKAPAKKSKR
jgi:DNA-binding protein HU-beta